MLQASLGSKICLLFPNGSFVSRESVPDPGGGGSCPPPPEAAPDLIFTLSFRTNSVDLMQGSTYINATNSRAFRGYAPGPSMVLCPLPPAAQVCAVLDGLPNAAPHKHPLWIQPRE